MARVTLENIYKTYSPAAQAPKPKQTPPQIAPDSVLKRINLTVEDGEFMVLVGASGCGKSTLLRLIAGLETVTMGNVWVDDRVVNDLPPKERDIAMVFQSYALYPHMRVYDNIAFGLRRSTAFLPPNPNKQKKRISPQVENFLVELTRGWPRGIRYVSGREKVIAKKVRQVAEMLQIEGLLERLPKQLSGGQKQRVALGRAIARDARVFLMDEPLSNLDAKLRAETRVQIVKLQRQLGITTIYVTHDRTEAMAMGDRIAVMNQGQIQQVDTPLNIYNHPANVFVAQFIGSPPMNIIPVRARAPLSIGDRQFRITMPEAWENCLSTHTDKPLLMGVRPEHFTLGLPATKNLHGRVETIEALGNDTYIAVRLLDLERSDLVAQVRISPEKSIAIGEEVWLSASPDKIHLFDPDSGLALTADP